MSSSSPVNMSSPAGLSEASSPVDYNTPGSTPSRTPRTPRSSSSHVPRTPTSAATPRRRSELGSQVRHMVTPLSDAGDEKVPSSSDRVDAISRSVIWGTNVSVQDSMTRFQRFFEEFVDERTNRPLYPALLGELLEEDARHLNLDCSNLNSFDPDLYKQLIFYPQEIIPIFDLCINRIAERSYEGADAETDREKLQVRTFNLADTKNMRSLDPRDIDTMVSIKGMVIRTSGVIPDMMSAFFRCVKCDATVDKDIDRGRIDEPTTCPNCKTKHSMRIEHNRCVFSDKQIIKLQETPDSIPQGETPHTVTLYVFGDLVDVAKPGDRVEITGIYRARPRRVSSRQRAQHAIYDTYVDVLHIKKSTVGRFGAEDAKAGKDSEFFTPFQESDSVNMFSKERIEELKELAARPDIYEQLTASIAPGIYEMDDVKRGILCQLFGGANKRFESSTRDNFRGEINVLLCGDPGTSKSQLLQAVHRLAPRGIYTSGKGSSAVGLTAYITKDPQTGEMILESGALVLSDRGICCIDEFDKMNDSTRSILHEVMEQQTVSIAKAGIVATLNARTSILASANPINSRYDVSKSVVANINLLPTILSRFDLIYLILDRPNEAHDRRLAKHLVSMYFEEVPTREQTIISMDILTDYISYARMNVNPRLSEEASEALVHEYVQMRQVGNNGGRSNVVTATTRQLESLIRLAEALARMRFSADVTREHVAEASRLIAVATQTAATDPVTGLIDMDLITTGRSAGDRRRLSELSEALRALIAEAGNKTLRITDLVKTLGDKASVPVQYRDVESVVAMLADEGVLAFNRRRKTVRPVS